MNLLNGFAATVDGTPVPETAWRLRKARELVKLLALAPGHRLHREQAMDVLWRDREPAAAANNLHQAVHVARRALDAGRDRGARRGADAEAEVDVEGSSSRPRRRAGRGRPAAYRGALALYGGELLPENRYDDWAEERRDELGTLAAELADELDASAPADDRPFLLPADASSFVGRERELAELKALLAARACSRSPARAERARRGSRSSSRARPSPRTPVAPRSSSSRR